MAIRIKLNQYEVRKIAKARADEVTYTVAQLVLRDAQRMVRVKSGHVRALLGIQHDRTRSTLVSYSIGSIHKRALLEHQGSPPHRIEPRRSGRMLRFYWVKIGQNVTLPYVNHPGTRGSKFLTSPLILHGSRHGFRVDLRQGHIPIR